MSRLRLICLLPALLAAVALSAAEDRPAPEPVAPSPAATEAGSAPAPAPAPAPAAATPAAVPTAVDWGALRRTLANERMEVSISAYRASIGSIRLLGHHEIPIPRWRGGEGKDTDTTRLLNILDRAELRPFGPEVRPVPLVTNMQHYVMGSPLPRVAGTVEGPWLHEGEGANAGPDTPLNELTLSHVHSSGLRYSLHYRLDDKRPTVHVELRIVNPADGQAHDIDPVLIPFTGIHQDDPSAEAYHLAAAWHVGGPGGQLDYIGFPGSGQRLPLVPANKPHPLSGYDWVAIKSRFFAAWCRPGELKIEAPDGSRSEPATWVYAEAYGFPQAQGREVVNQAQIELRWLGENGAITLQPGHSLLLDWSITVAPMTRGSREWMTADELPIEFTDAWYRFFRLLSDIMTSVLDGIHWLVGDYGLSILLLTLLIKGLLHRPNVKAQTAMLKFQKKMQVLQPELARLQQQYGKDRQVMAQKQMELWKKHGVSPFAGLSGCLPLLVQMPVFIALYQTFSHAAQMRGTGFLWVDDLTMPDQLIHVFDLGSWAFTLNPLPILYLLASLWTSLAMKVPEGASEQQASMQKMMRWMPLIFGFIFYNMPSGLVLYFTMSAILGNLEMRYIRGRMDRLRAET